MYLYNLVLENLNGGFGTRILYYIILTLIVLFICSLANLITRKILLSIITKVIKNNNFKWDDIMLENKVFHRAPLIIPGIIIYVFAPFYYDFQGIVQKIAIMYILIVISRLVKSLLDSLDNIYRQHPVSKERPIKGLLQIIEIAIYAIIGITIISILIDKNPVYLLSGIGAVTAVVSLIFKDTIIGFISGIQLTWNDMLRIGDWVEIPKYGADGDVIDITLYSVKIQNWDKSISTIPTTAFITDSFKNWRGMQDYGGRRVKRSILIDINSVKICTEEMIEKFKKIELIANYVEEKSKEIEKFNKENNINTEVPINGRQLTNLGIFRIYILNYLKKRINIHKGRDPMVRQLAPNENGIPLEIYVFIADTVWANYEGIQADIFDHILAVTEFFELKIFQRPSGNDIKQLPGVK
ncbi:MAG TPA: mechanosensitive ion channel [Tissierellia bacterium]|nr:mechanosensitive ion channel [Tissierellia bacterium]